MGLEAFNLAANIMTTGLFRSALALKRADKKHPGAKIRLLPDGSFSSRDNISTGNYPFLCRLHNKHMIESVAFPKDLSAFRIALNLLKISWLCEWKEEYLHPNGMRIEHHTGDNDETVYGELRLAWGLRTLQKLTLSTLLAYHFASEIIPEGLFYVVPAVLFLAYTTKTKSFLFAIDCHAAPVIKQIQSFFNPRTM